MPPKSLSGALRQKLGPGKGRLLTALRETISVMEQCPGEDSTDRAMIKKWIAKGKGKEATLKNTTEYVEKLQNDWLEIIYRLTEGEIQDAEMTIYEQFVKSTPGTEGIDDLLDRARTNRDKLAELMAER